MVSSTSYMQDDYGNILLDTRSQLLKAAQNVCNSIQNDTNLCVTQLLGDRFCCRNNSGLVYVAEMVGTTQTSATTFLEYLRMLGPLEISLRDQTFSVASSPSCPLSIPSAQEVNCSLESTPAATTFSEDTVTTTTTTTTSATASTTVATTASTTVATTASTTVATTETTTPTESTPTTATTTTEATASTDTKDTPTTVTSDGQDENDTVIIIVTIACLVGIVVITLCIIGGLVIIHHCKQYHYHSNRY